MERRRCLSGLITQPPEHMWCETLQWGDKPTAGCCFTMLPYEERKLILFGGATVTSCSKEVFVYDIDTGCWEHPPVFNGEVVATRSGHSAVLYGNKMIVYGGRGGQAEETLGDVLELDLLTWRWRHVHDAAALPRGPGTRYLHTAHVLGDRMYVFMGYPCDPDQLVWYLDLEAYTWHAVPQRVATRRFGRPPFPLSGHCSVLEGEYVYIFGGRVTLKPYRPLPMYEKYSNTLYTFHVPTHEWGQISPDSTVKPTPRYCSAMTLIKGRLFLYGGDSDNSLMYFDDFWVIEPFSERPTWVEICKDPYIIRKELDYFELPSRVSEPFIVRFNKRDEVSDEDPPPPPSHPPGSPDDPFVVDRQRPSPRSGMAYATCRQALYIFGGELPFRPKKPSYCGVLYHCPLATSTQLTLRENLSRWMATAACESTVRQWVAALPTTSRLLVERNLPSLEKRKEGKPNSD